MSLDTTALLARTDVTAVFLSEQAVEALGQIIARCRLVANTYGPDTEAYLRQMDSLADCLSAVIGGRGNSRHVSITTSSDLPELSLYCTGDDDFVRGMVFHRDLSVDGAAVVPGTWSLHS